MKLEIYKALWGMTGSLEEQLDRIAESGYDGVESVLPEGLDANLPAADYRRELEKRNLRYIALLFATDSEQLEAGVRRALECGAVQLTVHSGVDEMTVDQGSAYFDAALKIEEQYGVTMCHETHRGRILCNHWTTAAYLRRFPELKLVADISHFTCVSERLIPVDHPDLELVYKNTHHIHGRVGYDQGPQVPDPRAPEYVEFLERFEAYWDAIRERVRGRGEEVVTFDPEFGPPGYMHTLPYTRQPVADLWEICLWMAERTRNRWSEK